MPRHVLMETGNTAHLDYEFFLRASPREQTRGEIGPGKATGGEGWVARGDTAPSGLAAPAPRPEPRLRPFIANRLQRIFKSL